MLTRWRKARARKTALRVREAAHARDPHAGDRLTQHFPDALWPPLHSVVAGYVAIRDEIDPRSLLETFYCEQVRLALPCIERKDGPLTFRSWSPGEPLEAGPMGIGQPCSDASTVRPNLVLLPLVAFDRRGMRLGYGGGYYDRTLAHLRDSGPLATVGLAYHQQEVRNLPAERHDARLDWVVTDNAALQPNA